MLDDEKGQEIYDPDAPTGAIAVYGQGAFLFGLAGGLVGVILCVSGRPWHRILTCGAVGAGLGFFLAVVGTYLGRVAAEEERKKRGERE